MKERRGDDGVARASKKYYNKQGGENEKNIKKNSSNYVISINMF